MEKTIEGSAAIAETTKNCNPDVVACFPITPSTHIAEDLNKLHSDGEIRDFIPVEAEFSSISAIMGASAAGARAFSTTSSQGLALMHEAMFCAAGMRLSPVMVVANRALSAPLNIWNDHQDSVSERDSGWIQLFCESNQEACDTIPQAFKVAEKAGLPAMVCIDGFYLTHAVEQIDIPEKEVIDKFLPKFNPEVKLDPENPLSLGVYAFPEHYQGFRKDLFDDLGRSKEDIRKAHDEWAQLTGRKYGDGLIEKYMLEDAECVFIGMGSVIGNAKEAVDEMRASGKKVGVLKVRSYRPFPGKEIANSIAGKKVAVFEKAVSMGGEAPIYSEVMAAVGENDSGAVVSSFIGGLGGKDVTVNHVKGILDKISGGKPFKEWV
ncbi:MAG: transketolase C-terminal domain-containing protein [Candidatus Micrarchaeota archaeon]